MSKKELLEKLNAMFASCQKCPLAQKRINIVFGSGNCDAKIMLIGEAPGAEEDKSGEPFVGKSGKFLREQITAQGLDLNEMFITNIVKCRPPKNRAPQKAESNICTALILLPQIDIIKPKIVVTVGNVAKKQIESIFFNEKQTSFKVFHLPHPAHVIRTPKSQEKFKKILKKIFTEADKS